jgi:hypothetical protein
MSDAPSDEEREYFRVKAADVVLRVGEHESRITTLEKGFEKLSTLPQDFAAMRAEVKTGRWMTTLLVPLVTGLIVLLVQLAIHR